MILLLLYLKPNYILKFNYIIGFIVLKYAFKTLTSVSLVYQF